MTQYDKAKTIRPRETDKSNIPKRECKVIIISIFTGLEKGIDNISETFTKELKNYQTEMKNVINRLKTCLVQ